VLRCEAGCHVQDIAEALGLQLRDLFVRPGDATPHESGPGGELPGAVCALHAPPPEPISWTVEDLWTAGDIGLLVGDGGSFKSTAAVAMAAAIAGGYPVWGRFPAERRPVLIVSAEDPMGVVMMRLESFVAGHGWDRDRVLGNVHLFATPELTLSDVRWQAHLAAEAKRLDVGLVILDPLADLLAGDENSNTDVRPVIKWARALGASTKAGIAIVHHAGKAGTDKRPLDRIRGASALASAARTILFFEYSDTGVTVEHLKMSRAPKLSTFVLTRQIDSDPSNRAQWHSATLTYESARTAALNRAEAFIWAQVTASPAKLTTTDLKKAAIGSGISGEDIGKAITALQAMLKIDYEPGSRGAKYWFPKRAATPPAPMESTNGTNNHDLAGSVRQGGKTTLPTLPGPCPATSGDLADDLAPLKGAGKVVGSPTPPGKVGRLGPIADLDPSELEDADPLDDPDGDPWWSR
jgi:hypothetical protein